MWRNVIWMLLSVSCSRGGSYPFLPGSDEAEESQGSGRANRVGETFVAPSWGGRASFMGLPRAVTDCPTGRDPGWLLLDGDRSYDPLGSGLTYHWRVISGPATPNPSLAFGGGASSQFQINEPFGGPWEVGLRVEDAGGRLSHETTCRVLRRHPARLAVELSWEHGLDAADLDLHLVQGWADLWDIPGDCHFANINDPGWDGTTTTQGDGCQLLVDSFGVPFEAGPGELVYCHNPRKGVIDVVVDEFDGGSPEADEEPVMVRIWLDNRLIYDTLEQRPSTEWWVARVDLKTNTAIRLDPPVESEE
jgi:hypothetical protein